MSGGAALGQWEVKDCVSHKALSVCKHSIAGDHADALPSVYNQDQVYSSAPCLPGWESRPGFWHCYKVGWWVWVLSPGRCRRCGLGWLSA